MADKDILLALAERVLEGASRELDVTIARAIGRIPSAAAYEGTIKMGGLAWHNGCGYEVPAFTASLDAAMTLLPEGWWVQHLGQGVNPVAWRVRVERNLQDEEGGVSSIGLFANTPALALVAAALRAQPSSEES